MNLRFWRGRAIVCREAVQLMSDYLDGVLGSTDRARLERHLSACPHCSEYLGQLKATIDALGRAEPEALSEEALDGLVALYRQWRAG